MHIQDTTSCTYPGAPGRFITPTHAQQYTRLVRIIVPKADASSFWYPEVKCHEKYPWKVSTCARWPLIRQLPLLLIVICVLCVVIARVSKNIVQVSSLVVIRVNRTCT